MPQQSERIASHNLKTAIGWRAARAEILSAPGDHREAVALARDAVAVAADTDLGSGLRRFVPDLERCWPLRAIGMGRPGAQQS